MQGFLAGQVKAFVLDENVFELPDGATDSGFADAIGFADMLEGALLAPVHQYHQQPVLEA